MKLQKQLSKKRGDKTYDKYVVVLPKEAVKKARLKEGDELEVEAMESKIVLRKRRW